MNLELQERIVVGVAKQEGRNKKKELEWEGEGWRKGLHADAYQPGLCAP